MLTRIVKRKVDVETEKKILINLITDTEYLRRIIQNIKPEYFEIPYAKRILKWIDNYYQKYKEAPNTYISDIFQTEKAYLDEEEERLISDFLSECSLEFEKSEKKNTTYAIDSTLPYLNSRLFINLAEQIKSFANVGEIEECEKLLASHKKAYQNIVKYVNLNDTNFAKQALEDIEEDRLFQMPGVLGDMIGFFERGCVYGVMGRSNIGKTWFLREILIQGLMSRFKGAEFSLEMDKNKIARRHYRRITATGEYDGEYVYPIFDCLDNQNGMCDKKERLNKIILLDENGEQPEWGYHNSDYSPCTICRGSKDYVSSTWFETIRCNSMTSDRVFKAINSWKIMFGDNHRLRCFPKFTANISDIEHELDLMEYTENFIPDFITIDYDDILAPERFYNEKRHQSDETYKRLGGLVQNRNITGFIAIQTNREGAKKKKSKDTDIGEDWRKYQHLDGLIILNQTPREKKAGVLRVGLGKVREGAFDVEKEVIVLRNLSTGQSLLDSEN